MRYRKLDAVTRDRVFGHGLNDFWINVPDAVAQAVQTRLSLKLGAWFLDTTDGTDWNGKILGTGTALTRDAEIRSRTMLTPNVTAMDDYNATVDPNTRVWSASFGLETAYGTYQSMSIPFVTPSPIPMQIMPFAAEDVTATETGPSSADVSWTPGSS